MLPPPESKGGTGSSVWVPAIFGIIGVVLGGIGSFAGTFATLDSQNRAQAAQFDQENSATQRNLRTKAYLDFLSAYDQYNLGVGPYAACAQVPTDRISKDSVCSAVTKSQAERLVALRTAQDAVTVYGSDEALAVVKRYVVEVDAGSPQRILQLEDQLLTLDKLLAAEISGKSIQEGNTRTTGIAGAGIVTQRLEQQRASVVRELEKARKGAADTPPASEDTLKLRNEFEALVCREINAKPRSNC